MFVLKYKCLYETSFCSFFSVFVDYPQIHEVKLTFFDNGLSYNMQIRIMQEQYLSGMHVNAYFFEPPLKNT